MKCLLLFVCTILSSVSFKLFTSRRNAESSVLFMSNKTNPKLCYNCKYFVPDGDTNQFAKCSLFQTVYNDNSFLVTGIENNPTFHNTYCSTARNSKNLCGVEGIAHKRKYVKKMLKTKITLESELEMDLETALEMALETKKMPKKF